MAISVAEIVDAIAEHLQLPECPHDPINLQLVCDGMGNWTLGAQNTSVAKTEKCQPCTDKTPQ